MTLGSSAAVAQAQQRVAPPHDHPEHYNPIVEALTGNDPRVSGDPTTLAANTYIVNTVRWPAGATIPICFYFASRAAYQAETAFVERITALAENWVKAGAALTLDFGPTNQRHLCTPGDGAKIRIAFDAGKPRSSFLGTFRPNVSDVDAVTMNLTFNALERDPQTSWGWRVDYDVQHEFGHALGFIHEHQGSNCDDEIDFALLEQDLKDKNYITRNFRNWKTAYSGIMVAGSDATVYSPFCATSIMTYPIDPQYLFKGKQSRCYAETVTSLASCDRSAVVRAYPKPRPQPIAGFNIPQVALSALRLSVQASNRSDRQFLAVGAAQMQNKAAPDSPLAAQLHRLVELLQEETAELFDFNARQTLGKSADDFDATAQKLTPLGQQRLRDAAAYLNGRTIN